MASLNPDEKGAPPGRAPRSTRYALLAGVITLALAAPGFHYGLHDKLQVAAVEASRRVQPGRPSDDRPRETKKPTPTPTPWIQASHAFVCPADGSARLRLKVRGVSERCQPRYSWTANGGVIEGDGGDIVWNLSGIWPQPDKYYDAVVTVKTGPACGSRKASAIWRACVVCWVRAALPPPPPPKPRLCPSISFGTRATATAGQNVPVTATLNGGTPGVTPKFKWTVLAGGRLDGGGDADSVLIEAGKPGQTILAKVEVGGYGPGPPCSASCSIPVTPPPAHPVLSSVKLTPASASLERGTQEFIARAFDQFGRPMAGVVFTFESANPRAATIGRVERDVAGGFATALVNGHASGTTQISAIGLAGADAVTSDPALLTVKVSTTPKATPSPSITPPPSEDTAQTPADVPPTIAGEVIDTPHTSVWPGVAVASANIPLIIISLILLGAAAAYVFRRMTGGILSGGGEESSPAADATQVSGDEVHCTVFAPEQAAPGDPIIVQVFAHLEEQAGQLAAVAAKSGDEQRDRGSKQLDQRVERDTKLTFRLDMPGLSVYDPEQSLVWRGKAESVSFAADVPEDFKPKNVRGIVKIYYDGAPVGQIMFLLKVAAAGAVQAPAAQTPAPPPQEVIMYKHAFVSYSSKDRPQVLARMQGLERGLKRAGITCFMDKQDIEPGEQWAEALRRQLDECDLFYLFWSSNAKNSEEVRKEIDYALARKGADERRPPFFEPFTIELPLPQPLPRGLESLHFVEPILYEIKAEEAIQDEAAARRA
jgi:hypothetical protein